MCADGTEPVDDAEKPCASGRPTCANRTEQVRADRSRTANRQERDRDGFRGNSERGGVRTEENSDVAESGHIDGQESHTGASENGESDMAILLVGVGVGAVVLLVGVCVAIRAGRWHMNSKQLHCHVDKHGVSEVKGFPARAEAAIEASDIVLGHPVKSTLQVPETKCLDDAV